jgi:tetratricopeptide (TPR) repeat protein
MSYLLELLGRGLLGELSAAFRDGILRDDGHHSTEELRRLIEREPYVLENRRRLGARLMADRDFVRARDQFLEGLCLDARHVPSRLGLACALDELGQTRQAIEELQATLHHDDDAATRFALGFCHEKLGEIEEAVTAYEACIATNPQLANAHERLAAIALRLDDVPRAIAHYEHLCWCDPADLASNLTLANLYLRDGRHEDAIQRYQFALTIEPDNWEIQDDLLTAYIDGGRELDAIEILKGRIEGNQSDPDTTSHLVRIGDLYTKLGSLHEALAAFRRAVKTNPDCLEAAIKLGTANLRLARYQKAGDAFARAIEINDRIVTAYVGLGVAQMAAGERDHALASFEMAGGVEPNTQLLFSELARLQLKVTAAEQCERYLSPQAIAAHPAGPLHEDVRGVVARQIERFKLALRKHPNHADWHYRLGVLQRYAGELHGAIRSFRHALAINPNYLKALIKLGMALRDVNETDDAIRVLTRALSLDAESATLHYELGLIYADQGRFAESVERFDDAIRHEPDREDTLANLALSLQNMGLTDRAEATWQALHELTSAPTGVGPRATPTTDPARRRT